MKKRMPFLIAVLSLCLAFGGCISINSDIPAVATDPQGNVVTKADGNGYIVNYYNVNNGTSALADPNAQSQPVQQTQPSAEMPATVAPENTTEQQGGAVSLTTDEEKLNFFNMAVNKVKAQNAGFKKSKKTVGTEMTLTNNLVNAIANMIKDSLLPNDTTETVVNKGESSIDVMSPPGQTFVSALTTSDIQSITCENDGANYVITVYIPDATNPDATGSVYAKIFEFITVDDIMNTYAPNMNATVERGNVFFDFTGCYAKATIAPDGTLVGYETFVNGTMRLTNGKIRAFTTDLSIVLSSTTTYTAFQW
ncbi:MAG: hypothetical protein IKJ63_04200 [Clostridia bacterium]|nr:hypothetical protein [Clostridia bacterium]MBR2414700.1 hypothetical protein [Clostridia bacterium]MBR3954658.1 hypothetical protein [Clostridia bacterium]